MLKYFRRIQHTQENARLFEFTVKAFCDLARNSRQDSDLDEEMKEHLLRIVKQIGIPDYEGRDLIEDAEFEEVEEIEPEEEPRTIVIHDKKRKSFREISM